MNKSNKISFRDRVQEANNLVDQYYESNENIETISQFVSDTEKTRAFFVAWLSKDRSFEGPAADSLYNLVDEKIDLCADVLVKNLVMSAAMIVQHDRNNAPDLAEGSRGVNQRTKKILENLTKVEPIKAQVNKMLEAIDRRKNSQSEDQECIDNPFVEFLERWQYDINQLETMESSLKELN